MSAVWGFCSAGYTGFIQEPQNQAKKQEHKEPSQVLMGKEDQAVLRIST